MKKVLLGKTGIKVPRVIFGGIIVTDEKQEDADRFVSHAIDVGVDFFDVAPGYGNAEEKLGPALKRYRNKATLACKTEERTAKGARESLENSLRKLQTDYFDLFQLHALAEVGDVDKVFADDGAMSTIIKAKEEGLIKHIGFTAHNEETAILALSKYDFETVMFPINWALGLGSDFSKRLPELCKEKQIGLIAMKSLVHRRWRKGEGAAYPKSWCKPIIDNDRLGVCAIKYAFSRHAATIVPPGNFEHFCFAVNHIDECLAKPLDDEDIKYLRDSLPDKEDQFFVVSDEGRKTEGNRE